MHSTDLQRPEACLHRLGLLQGDPSLLLQLLPVGRCLLYLLRQLLALLRGGCQLALWQQGERWLQQDSAVTLLQVLELL